MYNMGSKDLEVGLWNVSDKTVRRLLTRRKIDEVAFKLPKLTVDKTLVRKK